MKRKLAILVASILLVGSLVGCSSSSGDYAKSEKTEMAVESKKEIADSSSSNNLVESDNTQVMGNGIEFDTSNQLNRKIIHTGKLDIETKTFNETIQKLMNETESVGGFMQDCYIEGDQDEEYRGHRRADMTVRIPKEQFDNFMNNTDHYGNVVSKSIQGEDVTDQYFDNEMRLETLQIQKDRLNELLKQAGDLEDLFAIEKELADVTYEIEKLKGTLNKYDSLIDFATVEISVYEAYEYREREAVPVTFGEKVQNQMKRSFEWAIDIVEGIVLGIIGVVPFMLIIGIPVGIFIWVFIKVIRKKK